MLSKKLKKPQLQTRRNQLSQKQNRTFSETFRKSKVKEILEKKLTVVQVSELYDVSRSAVYKWIYKYSNVEKGTKIVIEMESESLKTKQALEQIAELQRIIGQKQLEIDLLDKTLEQASEELGYDIKKKYAPKSLKAAVKIL